MYCTECNEERRTFLRVLASKFLVLKLILYKFADRRIKSWRKALRICAEKYSTKNQ